MYVNFNILNQLGSPSINSNTFANRPAAGQTGRLFVSTDTFEIYRDNGTSWDLIGGPGSSTVTGSGAAGQVTYWTGASTIAGNNNLFWDTANSRLGIGTATPGTKLDIHTTSGTAASLNSTNAVGNVYTAYQNQGTTQYLTGYTDDADINYRRFAIYDSVGAKEVVSIDQQSRYVGINYQYSSLADQPQYTLDVSGSARATDNVFLATSGTAQVGINTTSPTQATALIEAVKTDGYGLFLNYATSTGSGSTATALWALNTTAGSGYGAVIEEKTANTTGGQYPLLIKHSLSTGTAAAGMGTGLHFQLPDSTGTFKTTQLTVETTDAAAATYTTRYRFMAQVNGTSTALAYLTSVGLGIGNVIPSYKLDVNGTIRAFGAGNTGNYLAVDTNPGGATVQLNPQYGTGLPILQSVGSFPLLFGTNNTENARFTTNGNLLLNTTSGTGRLVIAQSNTTQPAITLTVDESTIQGPTTNTSIRMGGNLSLFGSNILNFATNGSERARFTNGGNFLIGTTSDNGSKLQVVGTTYLNGAVQITNSGLDTWFGYGGSYDNYFTSPGSQFWRNATSNFMTLDTFGNLGIGATPSFAAGSGLHIYRSSGGTTLRIQNTDTDFDILSFGTNANLTNRSNGAMVFGTNNAERMRITSAGVVAIATTTNLGGGSLEVQTNGVSSFTSRSSSTTGANGGTTVVSVRSVDSSASYWANAQYNAWQQIFCASGSTEVMRLTSGTNVLIGTTTDGGAKLAVNGAASINTTTNGQFSKLNVAGGIHFNNNTDSTVSNEGSYGNAFAVRTLVTGGAPAYTIKSNTGSEGALYIISGLYSNKRFCDIVLGLGSSITPVVISNTAEANFPATRTYSVSGENLQLALSGSDTYAIYVTGFGSNEKS